VLQKRVVSSSGMNPRCPITPWRKPNTSMPISSFRVQFSQRICLSPPVCDAWTRRNEREKRTEGAWRSSLAPIENPVQRRSRGDGNTRDLNQFEAGESAQRFDGTVHRGVPTKIERESLPNVLGAVVARTKLAQGVATHSVTF
jgi:hypothetical protein